ncbi:MAG: alpha/beta fold hydrolase [Crenarchaeota archaeon]|nr:alpha/beta fold hydrolase [Thermoproteota archaeon]
MVKLYYVQAYTVVPLPLPWLPLAGLGVALAAGYGATIYTATEKLVKPRRLIGEWHPGVLGLDYEDFTIQAPDGATLKGWLIDTGSEETVILLHGFTKSRWDTKYICPSILFLSEAGFNIVVYDQRGHGESSGPTTLGAREAEDAEKVAEWARRRLGGTVGVLGFSLGGAVALMLAARGSVEAAVADSPYIDVMESARRWVERIKGPMGALLRASFPLIAWIASRRLGIDPSKLNLHHYASRLRRPVLVIAGERDDLVPIESIEKFYAEARRAGARIELWRTPWGHVEHLRMNPRSYAKKVTGFLERWLRGEE